MKNCNILNRMNKRILTVILFIVTLVFTFVFLYVLADLENIVNPKNRRIPKNSAGAQAF
jgi:hypothetical protein